MSTFINTIPGYKLFTKPNIDSFLTQARGDNQERLFMTSKQLLAKLDNVRYTQHSLMDILNRLRHFKEYDSKLNIDDSVAQDMLLRLVSIRDDINVVIDSNSTIRLDDPESITDLIQIYRTLVVEYKQITDIDRYIDIEFEVNIEPKVKAKATNDALEDLVKQVKFHKNIEYHTHDSLNEYEVMLIQLGNAINELTSKNSSVSTEDAFKEYDESLANFVMLKYRFLKSQLDNLKLDNPLLLTQFNKLDDLIKAVKLYNKNNVLDFVDLKPYKSVLSRMSQILTDINRQFNLSSVNLRARNKYDNYVASYELELSRFNGIVELVLEKTSEELSLNNISTTR